MKFNPSDIVIVGIHEQRNWQTHDYTINGMVLFHERTYFPHNVFKPVTVTQWMPGAATRAEIDNLALFYGGHAVECPYAPEDGDNWFLAFNDTDQAIAFCQTEDYDRLALTMGKMEEELHNHKPRVLGHKLVENS